MERKNEINTLMNQRDIFIHGLLHKPSFIDKSLFIKELIDNSTTAPVITRPSGFGKTFNLSMVYHFFSILNKNDANYFESLDIWKTGPQYQSKKGKYPVIFMSFNEFNSDSIENFQTDYKKLMSCLYLEYRDVLFNGILKNDFDLRNDYEKIINESADDISLRAGLKTLTKLLYKQYKERVIILIDDYDIFKTLAQSVESVLKMDELLRSWLGPAIKDNRFLHKAILTAQFPYQDDSNCHIDNVRFCTVFDRSYDDYFGFKDYEIASLINSKDLDVDFVNYGGLLLQNQKLANCNLVAQSLGQPIRNQNKKALLAPLLVNQMIQSSPDLIKTQVKQLSQGETIIVAVELPPLKVNTNKFKKFWATLVHAGYLSILSRIDQTHYELGLTNAMQTVFFEQALEGSSNNISLIPNLEKMTPDTPYCFFNKANLKNSTIQYDEHGAEIISKLEWQL